jgi:hypothetical protein
MVEQDMKAVYIRAGIGALLIGAGLAIMISAMHATPCEDCEDADALEVKESGEDPEPIEPSSASAEEEEEETPVVN